MSKPDLDEMVRWPGLGTLSLRTALRRIKDLPPLNRQLVSLYRAEGCEPPIYDISHIEPMLAVLDED